MPTRWVPPVSRCRLVTRSRGVTGCPWLASSPHGQLPPSPAPAVGRAGAERRSRGRDPRDRLWSRVAVSLVCEQLAGGKITAIDRSATAIKQAAKRNADHLASGKAALLHIDLADLALAGPHFDKVFAVNVNLFWVRPAGHELLVIKDLLRPGGVVHLVYATPGEEQAERRQPRAGAPLVISFAASAPGHGVDGYRKALVASPARAGHVQRPRAVELGSRPVGEVVEDNRVEPQ